MTERKRYRVEQKINQGGWVPLEPSVEGSEDFCRGYSTALNEVLVVTLRLVEL